jgi:hypothetical protein
VKAGEQGADALPGGFYGALGCVSEQGFELGEDLLDRIEVWAVRRQEEQFGAGRRMERLTALPL